jgi:molybdenum cofactor sulfurtransferase
MDRFAKDMTSNLFGNPHSASASSQLSTSRIEDIRLRALRFFNADPAEFDLVFVANATAGIKLIADALRAAPDGFDYAYHQASHTSLVGVREEARNSLCLDVRQVEE